MSKIVEKDGLMTTTYHSDSDKVVIERNIDYKPIVEHNKKLYSENNGYSKSKDLKRVASIPTLVLEIWSKEYNGNSNWFALPSDVQKKILKKKLNSSEFQMFRTAPGRL
jgi:Ca2+-dependent lipid-binding protein